MLCNETYLYFPWYLCYLLKYVNVCRLIFCLFFFASNIKCHVYVLVLGKAIIAMTSKNVFIPWSFSIIQFLNLSKQGWLKMGCALNCPRTIDPKIKDKHLSISFSICTKQKKSISVGFHYIIGWLRYLPEILAFRHEIEQIHTFLWAGTLEAPIRTIKVILILLVKSFFKHSNFITKLHKTTFSFFPCSVFKHP